MRYDVSCRDWPEALGLILTARRAEQNRTHLAWKTNLRYEMEAFTVHAEQSRTEPDLARSVADICYNALTA